MPGFQSKSSNATPVWLASDDGTPIAVGGASGPQPAASSQSVTPANDGTSFPTGGIFGTVATQSSSLGARTTFITDEAGRLRVRPTGALTTIGVDQANTVLTPTDGNNNGVLAVATYNFTGGVHTPTRGDAAGTWVHAPASTPTMQGGTIAASGGTATVAFVSTADTEIVNPSTATLWGSWGTPAVNGANSYPIAPGGSYRPPNRPAGTFTLLSTAANQTYTATRF